MKYLRIVILLLILCNLPGYALVHVNSMAGSILSYGVFLSLMAYYILGEKQQPAIPFIIFGLLFSIISLLVSVELSDTFLVTFIKYFIFIITISTVLKNLRNVEIYCILLVGCLSIIYEAVFVTGIGGRYSGFYLNANFAAYACILGYAFGLSIEHKKLRLIGQILFSIGGLVTFSRTFLLIWILINLLSVFVSFKNVYRVLACAALFAIFLSFGNNLDLNTKRMSAFSDILGGKIDDDLKEGSRTETWALYYDRIMDHPLWGNGYHTFSGETGGPEDDQFTIRVGVHNTFLMVMGEAGIFALLYFLWIYGYIVINGLRFFKNNPAIFFISFSLVLYMQTNHNYFNSYLVLFTAVWLYHETCKLKKIAEDQTMKEHLPARDVPVWKDEKLINQYYLN